MNIIPYLSECQLFKDIDQTSLKKMISDTPPTLRQYSRSDLIDLSLPENKYLGVVISGCCEVIREHIDSSHTVLNKLEPSDCFGILSVITSEKSDTQIYFSKNTLIACFDTEQIMSYVNNYSQFSINLINFLANRLIFLNNKIATFSGPKVENKLASYILQEYRHSKNKTIHLNVKKCSEIINSGRASVYRAIDSLTEAGFISTIEKNIYVNDPEGLERITK